MCSGIMRGRVLNGEHYALRQKLSYLHLFTDCFMKISPQSSEQIQNPTVWNMDSKEVPFLSPNLITSYVINGGLL